MTRSNSKHPEFNASIHNTQRIFGSENSLKNDMVMNVLSGKIDETIDGLPKEIQPVAKAYAEAIRETIEGKNNGFAIDVKRILSGNLPKNPAANDDVYELGAEDAMAA